MVYIYIYICVCVRAHTHVITYRPMQLQKPETNYSPYIYSIYYIYTVYTIYIQYILYIYIYIYIYVHIYIYIRGYKMRTDNFVLFQAKFLWGKAWERVKLSVLVLLTLQLKKKKIQGLYFVFAYGRIYVIKRKGKESYMGQLLGVCYYFTFCNIKLLLHYSLVLPIIIVLFGHLLPLLCMQLFE